MAACAFAGVTGANGQLISNTTQIPRTPGKPPVVFINGYQNGCGDNAPFAGSFANADRVLQGDGRVSLFFNNCEQARNAPIEEIGNALRRYLEGLRYADGEPVAEVDVIAHSMGGIIFRSYLSGKQTTRGVFQPPAVTHVRKAVLLGVPFFGSIASTIPGAPTDVQADALRPGSQLLFDLATWNQGIDDLRGVDAVSVVGNAGTGIISPLEKGFDDSTVTLTSGSLGFVYQDRTRVVPYCHTQLSGLLALGCSTSTSLAFWNDATNQVARIALSFFNDTQEWRSIGQDVTDATDRGGLFLQVRDANDAIVPVNSAAPLQVRSNEVVWTDRAAAGPLEIRLTTPGANATVQTQVPRAATAAVIAKNGGPIIAAVLPSAANVTPRAVAPGMFASIYGTGLAGSVEQAPGLPYPTTLANTQVLIGAAPLPLHYASPTQINTVIPNDASGLLKVTVRSGSGQQSVNVLVEPAVPALFAGAVTNAVTGAVITSSAPAQRGDYIAIYLTGLGVTERRGELDWAVMQPQVTVGGQTCAVSYAGRAPAHVGLDQVNCQIAANAAMGDASPITVTSGRRTGTGAVAVR